RVIPPFFLIAPDGRPKPSPAIQIIAPAVFYEHRFSLWRSAIAVFRSMQSSSELFPVALVSAELRGDLSEDVYLLKPNNSPDCSVELALTRVGQAGAEGVRGVPVVLLHGSFSNRRFWYSPKGIGLGAYLA